MADAETPAIPAKKAHPDPFWSVLISLPLCAIAWQVWALFAGKVRLEVFATGIMATVGVVAAIMALGRVASLAMALDGLGVAKDRWPDARERLIMLAPTLLPRMLARLTSRDAGIRYRILEILGEVKDSRATPAIVAAIRHSDATTRQAAFWALAQYKDKRSAAALLGRLESGPESEWPQVKAALAALSGRDLGAKPEAWRSWWNQVGPRYPYQISGYEPGNWELPRV